MRVLLALIVLIVVAGCGGSSPEKPTATAEAATSTPQAKSTPEATSTPAAETELRALAEEWYDTIAANDPQATCQVLVPSERAYFQRKYGSCAKQFKFDKKTRSAVKSLRVETVDARGDAAVIQMVTASGEKAGEPVYAVKEDGKWGMARHDAYIKALH